MHNSMGDPCLSLPGPKTVEPIKPRIIPATASYRERDLANARNRQTSPLSVLVPTQSPAPSPS